MRAIDKHPTQYDDFVHPFWLGILILLGVMIIIGTICCFRIKCGSKLHSLINRLFGRNNETNDNSSNEDRYSTLSYCFNWPPIYSPTRSHSPKLYKLVKNIQKAKLEKQLSFREKSINEDENEIELGSPIDLDHLPQISISESGDGIRNFEIARKFYASMRNTSQCQNSSSVESYNNDASLTSNTPSLNLDEPIKSNREKNIKFFRTPHFFKSIPSQDNLTIAIK